MTHFRVCKTTARLILFFVDLKQTHGDSTEKTADEQSYNEHQHSVCPSSSCSGSSADSIVCSSSECIHLKKIPVCFHSSVGATACFNIQQFGHGDDFVKIDCTDTVFIGFYCLFERLDSLIIAVKGYTLFSAPPKSAQPARFHSCFRLPYRSPNARM